MRPWDAPALLRPPFNAAMFTPTKWNSAEDKAAFANSLARFIASDFSHALLTEKLYARLSQCFGHIAHYDRGGFIAEFLVDTTTKIRFLEQTMRHPCYGDPAFTHSDVEDSMIARLRACGILAFYRALLATEVEARERRLLADLRAKYEGLPAINPAAPPPAIPAHSSAPYPCAPPARRPALPDAHQPSLL
jgi:hypothetical protein